MGNILALDLSSHSSGWAVKIDGKLEYGCITDSSTIKQKRLITMREGVLEIVKKYNITKVIMEEVRPEQYDENDKELYSYLRNPATAKLLYWLQGTVAIALYEYNKKIEIEFIMPNSWRSKIGIQTGRGIKRETLKIKDIEYVKNKYNISVNDDIADAIGILDSATEPPKPITKSKKKTQQDLSSFEGFTFV